VITGFAEQKLRPKMVRGSEPAGAAGSCDLADDIGSAGTKSVLKFEDFSGRDA
jgi:hypothetical protein